MRCMIFNIPLVAETNYAFNISIVRLEIPSQSEREIIILVMFEMNKGRGTSL
jgi:hypothetical protein